MTLNSRIAIHFAAAAFLLVPIVASSDALAAKQTLTVWTATLPNSGQTIATTRLKRGHRYLIRVSGWSYFGKIRKQPLTRDACYALGANGEELARKVVWSSHGFQLCEGGYSSAHTYESNSIYGDGRVLKLRIIDQSYHDNYGAFHVDVILIR